MSGAETTAAVPWTPLIPDLALADGYVLRQLPPDEWWKLTESDGPFHGQSLPPSDTCAMLVLENLDGAIVKHWAAFDAVHIDGLWSREDVRGQHDRLFLGAMITLLQCKGVLYAHAIVRDDTVDTMRELARKVGFTELGRVFGGTIPGRVLPAEEP